MARWEREVGTRTTFQTPMDSCYTFRVFWPLFGALCAYIGSITFLLCERRLMVNVIIMSAVSAFSSLTDDDGAVHRCALERAPERMHVHLPL